MHYVYILRSINQAQKYYVGETSDLKRRLAAHNKGQSSYTKKYKPWELSIYVGFKSEVKAKKFEAYLKSGSGRAFAKRYF